MIAIVSPDQLAASHSSFCDFVGKPDRHLPYDLMDSFVAPTEVTR